MIEESGGLVSALRIPSDGNKWHKGYGVSIKTGLQAASRTRIAFARERLWRCSELRVSSCPSINRLLRRNHYEGLYMYSLQLRCKAHIPKEGFRKVMALSTRRARRWPLEHGATALPSSGHKARPGWHSACLSAGQETNSTSQHKRAVLRMPHDISLDM